MIDDEHYAVGVALLERVVAMLTKTVDPWSSTGRTTHQLTTKTTKLEMTEVADARRDVSDFELDDDVVGDDLFSFYANWNVHSYSD